MGFYPKHLKRRRHADSMRLIATAALSGCMFSSRPEHRYESLAGGYSWVETGRKLWRIVYPDENEMSEQHDKAIDMMLCMWPRMQLHEMRFLAKVLDSTVAPLKFLGLLYAAATTQEQIVSRIAEIEADTGGSII